MSMKDVIKKSVLEGFTSSDLFTSTILVTLALAAALGVFVYFIYRLNARDGFYNRSLGKTLALLPLITASIVLAMQSNLVVSLGMVGALSIVRFRNAVKNPEDLVFLFFSISMGILAGALLYELALIACLAFTVLLFVLDCIPGLRAPCLLVVCAESADAEDAVMQTVKKHCRKVRLRSRSLSASGMEMIIEVRAAKDAQLCRDVSAAAGVVSVNLLSHDGEMRI